jgi:hypothetical protein
MRGLVERGAMRGLVERGAMRGLVEKGAMRGWIGWKIQASRDLAPSAIIGYRRRVHIKEHLNRW